MSGFLRQGGGAVIVTMVVLAFMRVVDTVPSDKQTQELMLLEALGRRNPVGATDTQGFIDMLGRSRFKY